MTANLEVLGWFVAAVFMLLLKSLYAATRKICYFSSERHKLISTITSIKLAAENNNASPWPEHLAQGLREGTELIEKCSTVNIWNVFRRFWYSHKLTTLQDSLSKSIHDANAALSIQQSRRLLEEVRGFVESTQEISTETEEAVSNGFEQSLPREREMPYADGAHAGLQLDESLPDIVIAAP